jgi:enhancer of mRNA-decapping protein 4
MQYKTDTLESLFSFRLQSSLLTQLQEDLNKSLQETIQKEVSNVLMEQTAFADDSRSRAAQQRNMQVGCTEPMIILQLLQCVVSCFHPFILCWFQLRIEQLINEKDFANAFQEALTASDLNLVILVCQSCDPNELFAQDPCPLNQPILLSLIQQLSVDLSSDTELKNRYSQTSRNENTQ